MAESEARLDVGLLVVDNSGPTAADGKFAASVMRQLRRPIRLCSRHLSQWIIMMKLRRTPPVCSHIAKERFAGWCILGSTLQLPQSVCVACPKRRQKLRYVSYDGTTCLFLGCTNPKKQKQNVYGLVLLYTYSNSSKTITYLDTVRDKSNRTVWNHISKLQRQCRGY